MNCPLSISSLVDLVRVDLELLLDHLSCHHRADRATAVDTDHDDIVEVDLLAFCQFVQSHHVAAFDGHPDFHVLGPVKVFLDELGHEHRTAVERTCRILKVRRVRDQGRDRIVEVLASLHRKYRVNDFVFEGKLEEPGYSATELCLICNFLVSGPCVDHIAFRCHSTSPPLFSQPSQNRP